jgi:N-acetyl-anhydromuramyl-L-alanine amidase AmpD
MKVLVIHYTADDFDVSLATLTDNQVSSHYLIPEQPPLYQGQTADLAAGAGRGFGLACRGELLARQYAH